MKISPFTVYSLQAYRQVGIAENSIGESIAEIKLRLGCHVAVCPVDHAIVDHWWQLVITSIPSDHQSTGWIDRSGKNIQHRITRLYN